MISPQSPSDERGNDPAWRLNQLERLLGRIGVASWAADFPGPAPVEVTNLARLLDSARLGYANAAFAGLHGLGDPATLLGRPLRETLLGSMLSRPEAIQRWTATPGQLVQLETRLAEPLGRLRFFRVSAWLETLDGVARGMVGTLENITAERTLAQHAAANDAAYNEILGVSPAIERVRQRIDQVAATDSTVLIMGETGTGKELVARAIHQRSSRATRPLISINCGAIASGLVESELFGHERGAFTGALSRKIGRFELADGGTLFLDEIGDLPLDLQVKLLRVLQEGELNRVGGTQAIQVDVRVIAATHQDLSALAKSGGFRQDLYYRLNVFPIRSPALRERQEDIGLLVSHFVQLYAARLGKRIDTIPTTILNAFSAYPWPGNIRELANIIERSVIVTDGETLQLGDWMTGQFTPIGVGPVPVPANRTMVDMEREYIIRTLDRVGWKVSGPGGAAEVLNLKPTTLEARMKKFGIARPR